MGSGEEERGWVWRLKQQSWTNKFRLVVETGACYGLAARQDGRQGQKRARGVRSALCCKRQGISPRGTRQLESVDLCCHGIVFL